MSCSLFQSWVTHNYSSGAPGRPVPPGTCKYLSVKSWAKIYPSAAKKSYNLGLVFVGYVFPSWATTLHLGVHRQDFPKTRPSVPEFMGKISLSSLESPQGCLASLSPVTGSSDREVAVLSSVAKTAFPLHVQTEPLGTPTGLSVSCPSSSWSWDARIDGAEVQQRLDTSQAEPKEMPQAGAVPELTSPAGDRICSTQHPAKALWSIWLQTYPCAAALHRAAGAAGAII